MSSAASRSQLESPSRVRAVLELATMAAGALIAWLLLTALIAVPERDFEELALGRQTRSHYATVDGAPIHCGSPADAQPCLEGHAARGGRPVLLWLGNSQLHAINQLHAGDRTAPEILHHVVDDEGRDVLAFSMPNANFQELLVTFTYLVERLPIRQLIVPLVFDDFRESGLRTGVAEGLDDPQVARALEAYPIGRRLLAEEAEEGQGSLAALEGTVQERSESRLDAWLEDHWMLWGLRQKARGTLLSNLYRLRNNVFGITPQSKRRVIPGRFRRNLEALSALLEEAKRRDIRTLAYVVPLRDDVPSPYVPSEYEEFKTLVRETAEARGAVFTNLESLVPAKYWGLKDATQLGGGAELDFMHFQGPGHELLAHSILDLLTATRGDRG